MNTLMNHFSPEPSKSAVLQAVVQSRVAISRPLRKSDAVPEHRAAARLCFRIADVRGDVLAIPAPRGAAMAFVLAGILGLFLGATTIWENALVWGVGALILALFAYIGHRRKRRKAQQRAQTQMLASNE